MGINAKKSEGDSFESKKKNEKSEPSESDILAGRMIFGTLEHPKDNPYSGDKSEMDYIKTKIIATSSSLEYYALSQEEHKDGEVHYHFFIRYLSPVREGILLKLRSEFDRESKTNNIVFGKGSWKNLLGYVCKGNKYFLSEGAPSNAETIIGRYRGEKNARTIASKEGVKPKKSVVYEQEIISNVVEFMNKKDYKVNYLTRHIYGMTDEKFFEELGATGFEKLYGRFGHNLVKELIHDSTYYELPYIKPDLHIAAFRDKYYNIKTDKVGSLESMRKLGLTPFVVFPDLDFKDALKDPGIYPLMVEECGINPEEWARAMGRQLRGKIRRETIVFLHGKTMTGKSTLVHPYRFITRNVLGDLSNDGGFSWSGIAKYPFFISEEHNPYSSGDIQLTKKVFEGVPCNGKVKHGVPVVIEPKSGVITSNNRPVKEGIDIHCDAITSRMEIFHALNRHIEPRENIYETLEEEAGRVFLWCMMKSKRPKKTDV